MLYLILIIKSFKNSSNIVFIIKNIIISKKNAISSLTKVIKTILIITSTTITIKIIMIIMIIMIIITMTTNSKIKKTIIEKMFLIIKNVVAKIVTLSNLLIIKKNS